MKGDSKEFSRTFVKDPDPVKMPTSQRNYLLVIKDIIIFASFVGLVIGVGKHMNACSDQVIEEKVGMVEDSNSKNEVQINDDGQNLVYFLIKVNTREKTYIDELTQAFTEWKKSMPDGRIVSMTFVAPQMDFSTREFGLLVYYE